LKYDLPCYKKWGNGGIGKMIVDLQSCGTLYDVAIEVTKVMLRNYRVRLKDIFIEIYKNYVIKNIVLEHKTHKETSPKTNK
jgi:hypothetical protein